MDYDYVKQGDCLELMKEIPDGSVDMILCDLPYGTTQNKWDVVIPYVNATFYPKQIADVTTGTTTTAQSLYNPLPKCGCGCGN